MARGSKSTVKLSRAKRAGIVFPVSRIHRFLKEGRYAKRTSPGSSVYLAAVLEYLVAEILELSGNAAKDNKKHRIVPRHLQLAIRNDNELNKIFEHVTIAQGGVIPNIHPSLVKPKVLRNRPAAAAAANGKAKMTCP